MVQCHYRKWRVETHCTDTARDRCFVTLWRFQWRICYAGAGLELLYWILIVTNRRERAPSPWWHAVTRGRQCVLVISCVYFPYFKKRSSSCFNCFNFNSNVCNSPRLNRGSDTRWFINSDNAIWLRHGSKFVCKEVARNIFFITWQQNLNSVWDIVY